MDQLDELNLPKAEEVIGRYSNLRGLDPTAINLTTYAIYIFYKGGSVMQGVYKRFKDGMSAVLINMKVLPFFQQIFVVLCRKRPCWIR